MLLDDAKNYTFMTAGGLKVPGIDDVEEFASTQNSMKVMGISDEDMTSIWRVISSCLLFVLALVGWNIRNLPSWNISHLMPFKNGFSFELEQCQCSRSIQQASHR